MADPDTPKTIPVSELSPGTRFEHPLFHRDGTLLLLANAAVDGALLRALGRAGIEEVFLCGAETAVDVLRRGMGPDGGLVEVDAGSLPESKPLEKNLYGEDGELVCARGQPFTNTLLVDLVRRGELKLFEESSSYEAVRERFDEALAGEVAGTLEQRIDEDPSILRVSPDAEPLLAQCRRPSPAERTRSGVEEERRRHAVSLASTHELLERARREGRLDLPAAQDIVTELLERAEHDLPLTLALAGTALHHDYLVDHSLAVAIHSLAMGLALDYGRSQCAELALGALLHDVGMTRVSEQILEKRGPLGPEELAEIRSHPHAGVELLKKTPGAGLPLPFAVFQDHERADGRGYPRGAANGWIHDHAKVIAVADVYQAMTAPRPYKPRRSAHRAVLQLLSMVQEDVLDGVACRAFLLMHGVFPVGSWVRLADGRIARAVDSRGKPYDRPVVRVVGAPDGSPLETPETIDLSREPDLAVLEDLDSDSVGFDFTAGFHAEGPAVEEVRHVPPVAGTGGERRTVPTKFLDWSASFSGYLSDFSVLDLVKILDLSQKSGVLVLRFGDAEGAIRFSEGEMMGAEFTPIGGEAENVPQADEEAIYRMMEMREGTFRFEQCAVDSKKTVKLNNTMILMEGCRRMDEEARE